MAVLPDSDRQRVARAFMRAWLSLQKVTIPATVKTDIKAAVDATDAWIESNQAGFDTALPVAFRNNASTVDKTILFCFVALMRAGLAYLKSVAGEVD